MAPGCSAPPPSLSAQSVAARKRRKRISEKTQELARHIPGGVKLSTADMFQSAYKYIKFLEAQLAVLELTTPSVQECGSRKEDEYLYALLASLTMQEKLAAQEMCLVPLYELPGLKESCIDQYLTQYFSLFSTF
ncbi:transcription factor bHLH52-like [Dendrobium catenatum]|uniref:transcription factor bHLH52-like n=1 Tax=Dendrobium catenatum TaxID=906689 RepID=UPI00109F7164|nr:transcription factor bHLH52-like [Dendrobium catenatum]